jgi:hypothetical protein
MPSALPVTDPDDITTRAQLAREDAEPPVPPMRRNGHTVVLRYLSHPEPVVHLAFDGETTLCGQPWEWRVQSTGKPTCEECCRAVAP